MSSGRKLFAELSAGTTGNKKISSACSGCNRRTLHCNSRERVYERLSAPPGPALNSCSILFQFIHFETVKGQQYQTHFQKCPCAPLDRGV